MSFVIKGIDKMEFKKEDGTKILEINEFNEELPKQKSTNEDFIYIKVLYDEETFNNIKKNNIEIKDFTIKVDKSKWDIEANIK